jgi:hypothetical protein|tara:strand:+ start:252 stop:572 length:321 start_codon:yes stop_codon:yes gene_type:complete
MTHKLLASGQLGTSTGGAIYSPSGVEGYVKVIMLHNTNTSAETVNLYVIETGTPDSSNQFLKINLAPDESINWQFSYMMIVPDGETLNGDTDTASKVNYHIYGAEE